MAPVLHGEAWDATRHPQDPILTEDVAVDMGFIPPTQRGFHPDLLQWPVHAVASQGVVCIVPVFSHTRVDVRKLKGIYNHESTLVLRPSSGCSSVCLQDLLPTELGQPPANNFFAQAKAVRVEIRSFVRPNSKVRGPGGLNLHLLIFAYLAHGEDYSSSASFPVRCTGSGDEQEPNALSRGHKLHDRQHQQELESLERC